MKNPDEPRLKSGVSVMNRGVKNRYISARSRVKDVFVCETMNNSNSNSRCSHSEGNYIVVSRGKVKGEDKHESRERVPRWDTRCISLFRNKTD